MDQGLESNFTPKQKGSDSPVGRVLAEKELRKKAQKEQEAREIKEQASRQRLQEYGMAFLGGLISGIIFYGIIRSYQAAHTNSDQ